MTFRRSPLALAILGLLENGPLHPYGLQRLLKQWGKDQVVNVGQRTTLYRMIVRLEEGGLITAGATERDERYPERTVYHLTDDGRATCRQWLGEIMTTPRNEYPEFPAALSFVMLVPPETAGELLTERREKLTKRISELQLELRTEVEGKSIPRFALLETEYQVAVTVAEAKWIDSVLHDLNRGKLTWTPGPV
ncbi:PadR family transcriptional regulator [Kribbella solani]|uniref:DNA-binding PadR family transcriptional regulator n=1 Tax=Kribbella solani TaxID=236067 RepID=A0A841DP94_9ACTN|nr:PadR family transcriptional regulator [Kribbella solani]MBB5979629.1 DNA-binding PadR family transcriptional regulator [Kribbella solani]MDX2972789.1 PadR family transcriptional regulator [Kribbella solani]